MFERSRWSPICTPPEGCFRKEYRTSRLRAEVISASASSLEFRDYRRNVVVLFLKTESLDTIDDGG
jgi:hypothetical protein